MLRKFPLVVFISDLKLQPLPYYNENSFIVGKTSCSFMLCFNCDYITRRWRCEHSVRIFSTVLWDYAQKCTNEWSRFLHIFYIRVFSFVSQDVSARADFTKVFFFQVQWQSNLLYERHSTCLFLLIWFAKKCALGWPPRKAITKVFKQQLIWFTKVWCSGSKFLQRRAHGGLMVGLFLDHQSLFHYICLFTGQHISWWLIFMFHQSMIAKI